MGTFYVRVTREGRNGYRNRRIRHLPALHQPSVLLHVRVRGDLMRKIKEEFRRTRRSRENARDRADRIKAIIDAYGSLEAYGEAIWKPLKPAPPSRRKYRARDGKRVLLRSTWEASFCELLDALDLEWDYEPSTFLINGKNYTPDFFVYTPLGRCYVELHVMGEAWMPGHLETIEKIRTAQRTIPLGCGWPLVVLDETMMPEVFAYLETFRKAAA